MTRTGRIYKIIHNQSNLVYVGSTFNILRQRWARHKADYKRGNKISIHQYFKKYGIENFKMILIKEYQVEDRAHMEAYEQLWINKLKPINKNCALNLLKKEKEKKYNKEYREKNKEEIREKDKEYYEKNKEKIKKYYEKNKEEIREKEKKYRATEEYKEKFKKYRAQKRPCSQCGKLLSISSLSIHKKKYCKKREL